MRIEKPGIVNREAAVSRRLPVCAAVLLAGSVLSPWSSAAAAAAAEGADDAEITVDVDVTGTGATGAKVYLIGYRT